jgi:hypothetical protein
MVHDLDAHRAAAMAAGVSLPGRRRARAEQMIGVRSSHLGDTPGQFPVMPMSVRSHPFYAGHPGMAKV